MDDLVLETLLRIPRGKTIVKSRLKETCDFKLLVVRSFSSLFNSYFESLK